MPQFNLDLRNYKERFSATVPEGRYLVAVDDTEMVKTKAGDPMINVWLRIVEGEYAGETFIDRLVLKDNTLFRIVGFLNGLGFPTPKKNLALNTDKWRGRKVYVDTFIGEPYKGNPGRSEISGYARHVAEGTATDTDLADIDPADAPLPEPEVDETPANDDAPATATPPVESKPEPVKVDPETVNLDDIEGL